jgi:prolipoprotein diacylglyceryltransferase
MNEGFIFGVFLIVLFGVRFLIEFVKEPQVSFEQTMTLNMGQWLSIPFIIAGVFLLYYVNRKKEVKGKV